MPRSAATTLSQNNTSTGVGGFVGDALYDMFVPKFGKVADTFRDPNASWLQKGLQSFWQTGGKQAVALATGSLLFGALV